MNRHVDNLCKRYPLLSSCSDQIETAIKILTESFSKGGKLLLCGNGGSASDAEHIAGELMKGFILRRAISQNEREKLATLAGEDLGAVIQGALPAIPLTGQIALSTAVANDNRGDVGFAQQVYGLGRKEDVLMGLSTSGNATNVIHAFHVARLKGMSTILLTGSHGGKLASIADVAVRAPADKTYEIQELHLPIYHAICMALEEDFFAARS
jgi:D-sedoheptulose 7-phosphate isomerase